MWKPCMTLSYTTLRVEHLVGFEAFPVGRGTGVDALVETGEVDEERCLDLGDIRGSRQPAIERSGGRQVWCPDAGATSSRELQGGGGEHSAASSGRA